MVRHRISIFRKPLFEYKWHQFHGAFPLGVLPADSGIIWPSTYSMNRGGATVRLLTLVVPGLASLLATLGAHAHHAFATEFDVNRQVTLEGKVTKVELINPHSWIHLEVIQDGKPVTWMVEGGSPNALVRRGITKNSIPVGSQLVDPRLRHARRHEQSRRPRHEVRGRPRAVLRRHGGTRRDAPALRNESSTRGGPGAAGGSDRERPRRLDASCRARRTGART